jgi:hypothetical protein
MKFAKTLSRDEMKNVMAGGGCLYCFTPNGSEGWYRSEEPADHSQSCQDIYPAYEDGEVSGGWDEGASC